MEPRIFRLVVCFCLLQLSLHAARAGSLKFCATSRRLLKNNDALLRACNDLKQKSNKISCVIAEDRLSCLRMLATGTADFTVLEPEDLMVTTTNVMDSKLLVTHELKMFADNQKQHDVEMVVLVRNKFDSSWVTKDKRLCYVGFELGADPNYHYYYTNFFERWVVQKHCDSKKTLLENRIADLSNHFESACIAGPWSLDAALDGHLKKLHRNLCSLCGSPMGCFEGDRFYGMQGAISCLLENVGDIAWLSRSQVIPYFSELSEYGFNLLCPDGMFIPLSVNKTCTWIAEPRPTLVARSESADLVTKYVVDSDTGSTKGFHPVIHASYRFSHLANMSEPLTPNDYIRRFQGYAASKVRAACQSRVIRWCVSSNLEARKCGWMQAAALALDIEPRISCIQQKTRKAALEAVKDDRCDVFVAKPDEELHARGLNLIPVAHIISNKEPDASRFAAIVRKDAKFKSFQDLQGTNACFTGYKSVGWNSFFSVLRNTSSRWSCSAKAAITEFFNDTCIQGTTTGSHGLCKWSGATDSSLTPDENTFKCLMNGGDVAFMNVSAAKKYYSGIAIFRMNYRLLCQNETSAEDEPCYIAETTLGSVLASKNASAVRLEELYLALLSLDRFFGRTNDRETAMLNLYGPFDGQSDVIFPDKTQHLHKHVADLRHGKSYEEILASLQDEVPCGGATSWFLGRGLLLLVGLVILFF